MNKDKAKIAIFLDSKPNSGGAFQEQASLAEKIIKINQKRFEIIFICNDDFNLISEEKKNFFRVLKLNMNFFDRFVAFLRNYSPYVRRLKKYFFFHNKFENLLEKFKINLVLFLGPSQFAMYLENTDFVITVPDVSHREDIEFPEWTKLKTSEYYRRDEILKNTIPKALAVITNAEYLKKKISFFYKANENRIHIINQQPSLPVLNFSFNNIENERVKKLYSLPKNYLFYPAMFLTHKNHSYLIDALELIRKNIDMSLVLCGSDNGYLKKIKNYTKIKNLEKYVHFLNFVPDHDLPYLYKNSFALTMPTFSGPTNIPPWEAFKLETPVFYSNLEGARDVYKDAVYYIDVFDPNTLAKGVNKLFNDVNKRNELVRKAKDLFFKVNIDEEINNFFLFLEKRINKINIWKFD